MKNMVVCLLALSLSHPSLACLNTAGDDTKYNGKSAVSGARYDFVRLKESLRTSTVKDGEKMEAELRGATNFDDRNDYAVALIHLGRTSEAVDLLQRLEHEQPGHYFVAANLGTAFELSGRNEEALHWIIEGIRRNPDSHDGTEWLHARILEAKIAAQTDTNYFQAHSVLELNPAEINGAITVGERKMSAEELSKSIQYQLTERLKFVKPPDAPVASLLFDLAAIEAATRSLESARRILNLAGDYGYPPARIDIMMNDFDLRISRHKTRRYSFYGLIGLGVVGSLVFFYKRGIFVISSRDL